ncbi:MAG: porin [Terriglobia bacterium]
MNRLLSLAILSLGLAGFTLCVSRTGYSQQAEQSEGLPAAANRGPNAPLTERELQMLERIDKLEQRLAVLEAKQTTASTAGLIAAIPAATAPAAATTPSQSAGATATNAATPAPAQAGAALASATSAISPSAGLLAGTTVNVNLDGYYGYNFNRPVGRVNLLRAYDVSSNSFSLNQANVVIERAPDVQAGRRFGARLDLQYGQATESAQGNANNESRPQAYRPIWQAYGTYVAPIGHGLTIDFGKFASSLGFETNYTKDNLNYSRSYFFAFLPFYHFGLRAKYPVNDKLTVLYHLMNGIQQSEDFNGFKSQHFAIILTPVKPLSWQINYYFGREQRDTVPQLNPTFASLPTQPGLSVDVIRPTPRGRLHILDTYATWNVTSKLILAAEADYVINRVQTFSPPARVSGGAGYARYQFTPKFALAARGEYLSDRGGLFSGVTQALKEATVTADYKVAEGFLVRTEWRRDFSNQLFFLTDKPGVLKREQNTVTLGLIWWFGAKQGAW